MRCSVLVMKYYRTIRCSTKLDVKNAKKIANSAILDQRYRNQLVQRIQSTPLLYEISSIILSSYSLRNTDRTLIPHLHPMFVSSLLHARHRHTNNCQYEDWSFIRIEFLFRCKRSDFLMISVVKFTKRFSHTKDSRYVSSWVNSVHNLRISKHRL